MKKGTLIAVGLAVVVVMLGLIGVLTYVSYNNDEVSLRNRIAAQQDASRVVYDNTWKIIKEQAGVADKYKEAFAGIYPALMEGRYGNARGGALLSFVQESNPTFEPRLYEKLANSIESQRTTFTMEQRKLRDLKNSHDTLLDAWPGSWLLAGRAKVDVTLVTSTRTEGTFQSGKDDELLVK